MLRHAGLLAGQFPAGIETVLRLKHFEMELAHQIVDRVDGLVHGGWDLLVGLAHLAKSMCSEILRGWSREPIDFVSDDPSSVRIARSLGKLVLELFHPLSRKDLGIVIQKAQEVVLTDTNAPT